MKYVTAFLIALFLGTAAGQNAFAGDWSPAKEAQDGSFYTYTMDIEGEGVILGLYAYPENNCSIYIQALGETTIDADDVEWEHNELHLQLRVDKNPIKETFEGHAQHEIKTAKTGLMRFGTWSNDGFLSEFVTGNKLILRAGKNDGTFTDSVRFSLKGSSKALVQIIDQCSKVVQGGDEEWEDVSSRTSPQTGSSSDDSEWSL